MKHNYWEKVHDRKYNVPHFSFFTTNLKVRWPKLTYLIFFTFFLQKHGKKKDANKGSATSWRSETIYSSNMSESEASHWTELSYFTLTLQSVATWDPGRGRSHLASYTGITAVSDGLAIMSPPPCGKAGYVAPGPILPAPVTPLSHWLHFCD